MKQRCQIDDFGLRQLLHDARQLRQLMVVARQGKTPQVADDEERVRIDRISVKEVVLHAPDDASEGRDVASKHAIVIHAAQLVGDARAGAQHLEKEPVMARILAELLIDQPQIARHAAHGRGAHAFDLRVLLQDREQLQQRRRSSHEDIFAGRLERAVTHLKARVERVRRPVLGEDRLAKKLQQKLIQQAHVHDRAVVALHELLNREGVRGILVAKGARELDLMVKQQPVLVPRCR